MIHPSLDLFIYFIPWCIYSYWEGGGAFVLDDLFMWNSIHQGVWGIPRRWASEAARGRMVRCLSVCILFGCPLAAPLK